MKLRKGNSDYPRLFEPAVPDRGAMEPIDCDRFDDLFNRLSQSNFRRRFHLDASMARYVQEQGFHRLRAHARAILDKRLAPAVIANDGSQTPYRGHPVFVAQHATGCCCRGCLAKWHSVPRGVVLNDTQLEYVTDVLMSWIAKEMKNYD